MKLQYDSEQGVLLDITTAKFIDVLELVAGTPDNLIREIHALLLEVGHDPKESHITAVRLAYEFKERILHLINKAF